MITGNSKLTDGLWEFTKPGQRKKVRLFIKDGRMWLPIQIAGYLLWIMTGNEIMLVDKRTFIRASDYVREFPQNLAKIQEMADRHGVAL